jgi:hypothetical protein
VLLDAQGVIAPAVEAFRVQPTEIFDPWQRDRDETIEKLIHPRLAQCDLGTDMHPVA